MSDQDRFHAAANGLSWDASPTTAMRWLGREVRTYRELAEVSLKEAGEALRNSPRKVSYLESGVRAFKPSDLEQVLLPLYEVDKRRWPRLLAACRRSRERGWWEPYGTEVVPEGHQRYIGLEQGARTLRSWSALHPHDLAQAPEYARGLLSSWRPPLDDADIEARVEFRDERREAALRRHVAPTAAHFVLDEAVAHRAVGGPAAMEAQLRQLVAMASWPNVTIQVVPYGPLPEVVASFTILGFSDGVPDVAYLDGRAPARYPEGRNRDLGIENPEEVASYEAAFADLAGMALPPAETISFIDKLRGQFGPGAV